MGGVPDYQYIHGMMLKKDGNLSNALPNFHFTIKASKKHDPNNPTLPEDMSLIHNEEWKEATE